MIKEIEVNLETGKKYELKPDKYKQFKHLQKLKDEVGKVDIYSKEYWRLRCIYLEKSIDETYSITERDNCYEFYRMLIRRNK